VDAGPLAALLRRVDSHHQWASDAVRSLPLPFVTSEAVISETCFLLQRDGVPIDYLFEFFANESLIVPLALQSEWQAVRALMKRYSEMPKGGRMSLADATLVRLAEIYDHASVFTIDSDFRIYRKHGRRQIPLIIPDDAK
jgi:predicted nucleic acid-binding protein